MAAVRMFDLMRPLRFQNQMRVGLAMTRRRYSTPGAVEDIRKRLTDELKTAMKARDSAKSTTIRAILSEVYSSDKTQAQLLPPSAIVSIIRKAASRRIDAASEFDKGGRPELAEKERKEADLLQDFLPALLEEADIDRVLHEIIAEQQTAPNDKKAMGMLFKAFYAKVDKSLVDSDLVKSRAEALVAART
ncbi:GatB/YqeY domain-containing protein [Trametopsis cervina]|nr:GatB/YqeY domain-containing protein [Trametopsis cervina]